MERGSPSVMKVLQLRTQIIPQTREMFRAVSGPGMQARLAEIYRRLVTDYLRALLLGRSRVTIGEDTGTKRAQTQLFVLTSHIASWAILFITTW